MPLYNFGGGGGTGIAGVTVAEADGSPAGTATAFIFSNSSLAFSGGTATVYTAGTTVIPFVINGGGSAIGTGVVGDLELGQAYTIVGCDMFGDTTGTAVVDIYKAAKASFPPVSSICASAKPTITNAAFAAPASNLASWTTSISAGDVLRFNVDSNAGFTRLLVHLAVTRTA